LRDSHWGASFRIKVAFETRQIFRVLLHAVDLLECWHALQREENWTPAAIATQLASKYAIIVHQERGADANPGHLRLFKFGVSSKTKAGASRVCRDTPGGSSSTRCSPCLWLWACNSCLGSCCWPIVCIRWPQTRCCDPG